MDRISYLPQEIRDRILSFLPTTKDIVKTSALSTRWRKVCATLSNFSLSRYQNPDEFNNVVDHLLSLHDNTNIEKFKIFSILDTDEKFVSHLNEWVSFAVSHNVSQLQLWIYVGEIQRLPVSLFTCQSLTSLVLYSVNLSHPVSFSLPNLTLCMFSSVTFSEQGLSDQFFSYCPSLDDLRFDNCKFEDHDIVTIDSPRLKILDISDSFSESQIKVSSKILQKIKSKGDPRCIGLENVSSLQDAFFSFTRPPRDSASRDDIAIKNLTGLANVTKLTLGSFFLEFLTKERDLLTRLPISPCLKDLKLDFYRTRNQIQVISFLFKIYPNLQNLHISSQSHCIYLYELNTVPYTQTQEFYTEGVLKKLDTITIDSFEGSDDEFDLVGYLLNNASVVEEMKLIISLQKRTDQTAVKGITEKLRKSSRISSRLTAIFLS